MGCYLRPDIDLSLPFLLPPPAAACMDKAAEVYALKQSGMVNGSPKLM